MQTDFLRSRILFVSDFILVTFRIIGLDKHPDVFAAAALENKDAGSAKLIWVHGRQATAHLDKWASKHLQIGDILVLED